MSTQPYTKQSGESYQNPSHPNPSNIGTRDMPCKQCGTVYPLPDGATSWRCKNCRKFNDLEPTCCIIL